MDYIEMWAKMEIMMTRMGFIIAGSLILIAIIVAIIYLIKN